jgi:hypothetical protein
MKALLSPVDVWHILEIPINNQGFEDFVSWHYTKHGRYTVHSRYHLQWRHQFGPSAGQLALPGSSALNPVRKNLWWLRRRRTHDESVPHHTYVKCPFLQ